MLARINSTLVVATVIVAVFLGSMPVRGAGLLGNWKLDETGGSSAADSSGNGLNGTIIGSPTLGYTGALGGTDTGYYLNGTSTTSDGVNIADSGSTLGGTAVSLSVWVTLPSTGSWDRVIMRKKTNSFGFDWGVYDTGTNNAISDGGSGQVKYGASTSTAWQLLTETVNGSTITSYLNGVSKATSSSGNSSGIPKVSDACTLGYYVGDSNHGYVGGMDDAAVWSQALTAGEVGALYSAPLFAGLNNGYYGAGTMANLFNNTWTGSHIATSPGDGLTWNYTASVPAGYGPGQTFFSGGSYYIQLDGSSAGGTGVTAAGIPEPGTLALLAAGLAGLLCYAWRNRR